MITRVLAGLELGAVREGPAARGELARFTPAVAVVVDADDESVLNLHGVSLEQVSCPETVLRSRGLAGDVRSFCVLEPRVPV